MLRLFLVTLIVLFAAFTGMVARRIYVDQAAVTGHAAFYVGSRQVRVERAMIRNVQLRDGGAVNRLDLVLAWPDLHAAGASSINGRDAVFIALEDATQAMRSTNDIDPSQRPNELYAKFLEPDPYTAPGDLLMRKFRAGSPYDGEELYVATPDEAVFSARCPTATAVGAAADELCLWQTRIAGFEVHTRFDRRHLEQWPHLVTAVSRLIPQIQISR